MNYTVSETALSNLFTPHGVVKRVNLITDHYTRQSKGFGYIEMPDSDEASSAIRVLHGTKVDNQRLIVKKARTRDQRGASRW